MAITGDGRNYSTTPAMGGLRLPTPGVCGPLGIEPPGFSHLELINGNFSALDGHNHTPGYGIPVPAAGILVNSDLPFGGNNATALRSVRFSPIGLASLGASDLSCLAVSGGDLYFIDAQANQVRLTASGGVAGTPGSISSLAAPAAASYIAASKLFTFTSSAGFVAGISAGPLSIGDATIANGKTVTLSAPAGLAANYSLTLPTGLPAANALLGLSTTGALSAFGTVSGSDLTLAGNLSVAALSSPAANSTLQLSGNKAAGDLGADVYIQGFSTRTAGFIADFRHGGGDKLFVDYQGLLRLASQAGPIQPTSYVTFLVAANPSALTIADTGYWKDATGKVQLRGGIVNTTGAAISGVLTSAPLPAGFRPGNIRYYAVTDSNGINRTVQVGTDGTIQLVSGTSVPAAGSVYFDGISFLADR